MQNLKSKVLVMAVIFSFLSCSIGGKNSYSNKGVEKKNLENIYKEEKIEDRFFVITVQSSRVLPVCERLENGMSGFMIMILDDENTVSTATGRMEDQSLCEQWIKRVSLITSKSERVKIFGLGNFDTERKINKKFSYHFKEHGRFYDNARSLNLQAIINEDKNCFSMFTKTCTQSDLGFSIDVMSLF